MSARSTSVQRQATPPSWLVLLAFAAASFLLIVALGETALRLNDLRFTAQADPRCAASDAAQASQKGLYIADAGAGYVMRRNACVRLRTAEYDEVLRANEVPGIECTSGSARALRVLPWASLGRGAAAPRPRSLLRCAARSLPGRPPA
jgi:hypothetical protein